MVVDQQNCTGCTACSEICPEKCIIMKTNAEGFLSPIVNVEKCVHCNLCEKVCIALSVEYEKETKEIYAYKNSNTNIREHSTSGGFFSALSELVLDKGGVIYGAVFDENYVVKHIRATDNKDCNRMRNSKYVQSDIRGIIPLVMQDLLSNRLVLFTGTPCQVAALKRFLELKKCDLSNLITCDFVCHGTPSPLIWEEYIKYIKNKYSDDTVEINFRDKTLFGWHKPVLKIKLHNNTQVLTEKRDPFYLFFYSNCILRPSCHFCKFTKRTRVSDITMGDCWGIEKFNAELDDNKGVSLLLINTNRGKQIFSNVIKNNEIVKISYNDVEQPHLYKPVKKSKRREEFWYDYFQKGFLYVLKHYTDYSYFNRIKNNIKGLIVKVIK